MTLRLFVVLYYNYLSDLGEKIFKRAWWPKCFFVKPSKARTVTLEQLDALFCPLNLL